MRQSGRRFRALESPKLDIAGYSGIIAERFYPTGVPNQSKERGSGAHTADRRKGTDDTAAALYVLLDGMPPADAEAALEKMYSAAGRSRGERHTAAGRG
jgi:hypothetical protein